MWERINRYKVKVFLVLVLVGMLAMMRLFEGQLFYDPFLTYFRGEYADRPLPVVDEILLLISYLFRYAINTALSLAIIQVLFSDRNLTTFAAFLYGIFFIIFVCLFFAILLLTDEPHKMYLFYVRRFLIQPILLLLFIPAFYFQNLRQ